jgi:hypothetical protein
MKRIILALCLLTTGMVVSNQVSAQEKHKTPIVPNVNQWVQNAFEAVHQNVYQGAEIESLSAWTIDQGLFLITITFNPLERPNGVRSVKLGFNALGEWIIQEEQL